MIPSGVEVFMAVTPIDLRWGFNRLAGLVVEAIGRDVRCGALFLFFGKRRAALKVLFFDGSGLCLFYKRLDRGLFRLPLEAEASGVTAIAMSEEHLSAILDGVNLEDGSTRQRSRPRSAKPPAKDRDFH